MSITLAAHPLEPLSRSPCSSRTPTPCVHAAAAVTQMPSPPTTTPPSSQSSSTSSPSTTITPLFHLQLTAASSVSLALDATTSLPASGPAFGQADDTPVEDDIDETGSATSELPYPACDLKRVRFPCPVAEAERFASLHVTYSPAEYDRTPILISEEGRSCVLPERGSKRCYFYQPDVTNDLVIDELAAGPAGEDENASEVESDESAAASAVSADEDEMMDRRIAMMRSMGLAVAAGLAAAMDDAAAGSSSSIRRSPSGTGDHSPAAVETEDVEQAGQKELDDELVRIRERCRTRFGLWRVETAEFASEDPNACGSPREPCTPNPSPMSPPMALGGSASGTTAADGNSPTPPAVVAASSYSYFGVPSDSRRRSSSSSIQPIAIPPRSASGAVTASTGDASGSGSSPIDGPASATPTSSLVGLAMPRRIPSRNDEDGDETGSPTSLGAASPATRRMMWCQMMRSGPLPTAYTADDSEEEEELIPRSPAHRLEDEEEHQDESRGMRRWLFDGSSGGPIVSDSPPPTPGWDDGASSFLAGAVASSSSNGGRPALARTSGGGFPFTRVRSLPASSSTSSSVSSSTPSSPPPTATSFSVARNGSSSTVHLGDSVCTLAFAKKSPPVTPSAPTASLLRSAFAPSPPTAIDTALTPTASGVTINDPAAYSIPTASSSAADFGASASASSLHHLLASPSSSACSSTDTFLTDSDPPSLVSLASGFSSGSSGSSEHGEPTDSIGLRHLNRWDLHTELARSPAFRSPSAGADKRDDVFGGWPAGAEASEYLLGSRDIW